MTGERQNRFAWCYSERMNWWQDQVPDGAEAAIRTVRDAIAQGRTDLGDKLSAELAEYVAAGQKRMAERANGKYTHISKGIPDTQRACALSLDSVRCAGIMTAISHEPR